MRPFSRPVRSVQGAWAATGFVSVGEKVHVSWIAVMCTLHHWIITSFQANVFESRFQVWEPQPSEMAAGRAKTRNSDVHNSYMASRIAIAIGLNETPRFSTDESCAAFAFRGIQQPHESLVWSFPGYHRCRGDSHHDVLPTFCDVVLKQLAHVAQFAQHLSMNCEAFIRSEINGRRSRRIVGISDSRCGSATLFHSCRYLSCWLFVWFWMNLICSMDRCSSHFSARML